MSVMNPTLIDYILRWLAPSEYKLELKNRLENLCSLSGTPMSPGLHQWVTKKFGLEMTRVIEDYSTFTSPKLSPELLSVVDRIVPTNYQGYDANLGFRQLFDVTCASPVAPKCLYYAETFNYSSGWSGFLLDIDGTYFPSTGSAYEIGTSIQTAYNTESGGYGVSASGQNIKLWSVENDPITTTWQILNYDDFNFYQVDMFLLSCDLTTNCYQVNINQSSAAIIDFNFAGNYFGSPVDTWSTNSMGMTTSDPQFVTLLQSIFGGQAIITVNDNGTSTFIQIDNCYEAIHPKTITLQGGTGTTSYNFTTCLP